MREPDKAGAADRLELTVPPEIAMLLDEDRQWAYPPGMRPYEPLREVPSMYLEFMALGEATWDSPESTTPDLAQRVLDFTREYGPLTFGPLPTLGDVLDEAKSIARVGMAHRAYNGDSAAEKTYWPRALWAYGPGFDSGPTLPAGSAALRGFIAVDIEQTVNHHLKTCQVFTQVGRAFGQRGQPPGFEPAFEPLTLRGAIWAQLAASLIRGSVFRRCNFRGCRRIFEAPSPRSRLAYCPERECQVKENDRIKYEKRKARKAEEREAQDGE
jgi:hypothetical protein